MSETEDRLDECLARWEHAADAGRDLTPLELCPDGDAAFLDTLADGIACLKRFRTGFATPAPDPNNDAGRFAADWYEGEEAIEEGGQGLVIRARDRRLGRAVAIKVPKARWARLAGVVQRFEQEARIAGGLEHPGVVPVYGFGRDSTGRPYYAMRYVRDERTLGQAIADVHATPEAQRAVAYQGLLRQFLAVCRTVAYAHDRGVVHRDIKPANVLVGQYGEVFVVDWGIAKELRDALPPPAETTPVGGGTSVGASTVGVLGTPAFMSPEQAEDAARVGPATDVYSLGATLYQVLTGAAPFTGAGGAPEVLRLVKSGALAPPHVANPLASRALSEVCRKAMAVDPAARYATAGELADDVERWLADEPVRAWRDPLQVRARRWAKRHRTAVAAAVAAALVGLVALSFSNAILAETNRNLDKARKDADDNAESARTQAGIAEEQRSKAQSAEQAERARADELRRVLYVTQVRAASEALAEANPMRARTLLLGCEPALRGVEWRHLLRQCATPGEFARRDHSELACVSVTRDGRLLAVGGDARATGDLGVFAPRGQAHVVDVRTGKTILHVPPAKGEPDFFHPSLNDPLYVSAVKAVTLSSDGKLLAVANTDSTAQLSVWAPETGKQMWAAEGAFESATFVGGATLVAASHLGLKFYEANSGKLLKTVAATDLVGVVRVELSADGKYSAWTRSPYVRDADPRVVIVSNETGKVVSKIATDIRVRVNQVAFSPDNRVVAVATELSTVALHDPSNGKLLGTVTGHEGGVSAAAFSPGGTLATAGRDRRILLWGLVEKSEGKDRSIRGNKIGLLRVHDSQVRGLAFFDGEKRLVSVGSDSTARVWEVSSSRVLPRQLEGTWEGPQPSTTANFVATTFAGRVVIWDPELQREQANLAVPAAFGKAFSVDAGGERIAGVGTQGLRVWEARSGRVLLTREDASGPVQFSRDGGTVFTASRNNREILAIGIASGNVAIRLPGATGLISLSPRGTFLASVNASQLTVWDVARRAAHCVLDAGPSGATALAFSPDGKWLAVGCGDHKIRVWDVSTGALARVLDGHTGGVSAIAFDSTGTRLITGSEEGSVRVWCTDTWMALLTVDELNAPVRSAWVSADGLRILASAGKHTFVWETLTEKRDPTRAINRGH